jgi:hypothetical protein
MPAFKIYGQRQQVIGIAWPAAGFSIFIGSSETAFVASFASRQMAGINRDVIKHIANFNIVYRGCIRRSSISASYIAKINEAMP